MSTSRSRHRAPAVRPEADAQMDAALAGDGDLDSYLAALSAADAEHPTELTGRFGSAQVFQLRLPALRIEQLRRLAEERGVSPGALAVDWVIDRLDREAARPAAATGPPTAGDAEPARRACAASASLRRLRPALRSRRAASARRPGWPVRAGEAPRGWPASDRHGLPVNAVTGTAAASAR